MHGGWIFFFKINKRDSMFVREMRVVRLCSMELDNFGREWWCVCCKISMHLMHNAADDGNGKGIMSPEYSLSLSLSLTLSLTWQELSASST